MPKYVLTDDNKRGFFETEQYKKLIRFRIPEIQEGEFDSTEHVGHIIAAANGCVL